MSAQTQPDAPDAASEPPEEPSPSPPSPAPARERSPRADSPAWRRVEAVGKVYFAACRQVAALLNTLGSQKGR